MAASAVVLSIYGSQQTVSCCGCVHSTEGLMRESGGEGEGEGERGRGGREGG